MTFSTARERDILERSNIYDILAPDTVAEVRKRYHEPHRCYHNWDHALTVLQRVTAIVEVSGVADGTMPIAALYHDAVYVVGATDNELLSCDAFCDDNVNEPWFRTSLEGGEHLASRVCRYIQATAKHGKLEREDVPIDTALFMDCDMLGFAEPDWATFVAQDYAVIAELMTRYDSDEVAAGRETFLRGLLAKRSIFLSDYFANYEGPARSNIERLLAR